jgi:hypothetical protein
MLLVTVSVSRGSEPPPRQIQISLTMKQGDPLGSREEGTLKVLAEPRLVTLERQPGSFLSGGEVRIGGEMVHVGKLVKVTAEKVADGRLLLGVVLEHTDLSDRREDSAQFQTSRAIYSRTVKPGEVLRLRWGKNTPGPQTWAELSVREVTTQ